MAKNIDGITVNDGNGLMDNEGLIDSLIVDCNSAVQRIVGGNYIAWCNTMVSMVQKLANLKKGIAEETEDMRHQISELEKLNREIITERSKE